MNNYRCYVCGSDDTSPKLIEAPIEQRFGMPVLPSEDYRQNQCKNCGLLFVTCDVTEDYLNKLYSSESVEWQKDFRQSDTSVGNARLAEFHRLAHTMIAADTNGYAGRRKLLDFGCQTGEFGAIVQKLANVEPSGVEMSEDYAGHARTSWGEGQVHVGSLDKAPFDKGSFDFISAQETLEHLVDPQRTLTQLRSLLKDGGIILISVPSSDYFVFKKRVFDMIGRKGVALVHTHLYNFTPKSLSQMLEQSGFKTLQTFGIGWHGKAETIGNAVSGAINAATLKSRVFSPSVVALARAV